MTGRDELPGVRSAHSGLLADGVAPAGVREIVADSWLRSVAAGVNADASQPPITLDHGLLSDSPEGVRFLIRSRLLTDDELTHFQLL